MVFLVQVRIAGGGAEGKQKSSKWLQDEDAGCWKRKLIAKLQTNNMFVFFSMVFGAV